MGVVVRLFFLMILSSFLLALALGWFAMLKARTRLGESLGLKKKQDKSQDSNAKIIDGEYRVLSDENEKK
jgi:hypothetical protein